MTSQTEPTIVKTISFTLNGQKRRVTVATNDILADVLRDKLGVKSVKIGCGRGDCGTCTILLNGKTVRSCLILAIEAAEHQITTLEGIHAEDGGPTILQQAFIDENAFQCGYCAPGMTLSATELLRENTNPSVEEIKEAIAGNLCRCTGYESIIKAILTAAKKMREKKSTKREVD